MGRELKNEPQVPADNFRDIIPQLLFNKDCHSCYGKGYTGIAKVRDDKGNVMEILQLCKCAMYGETAFVKIYKQNLAMMALQNEIKKSILEFYVLERASTEMLKEQMLEIARRERLWFRIKEGFKRGWVWIKLKVKKTKKQNE